METKFNKFFRRIIEGCTYLFVFLLPWQTKLIIRPASSNFNEISLYLSHLLLLVILALFLIHKIRRHEDDEPISGLWWALTVLDFFLLASFFVASDQVLAFYYYVLFLIGLALFYLLFSGLNARSYEEPFFSKTKLLYSFLSGVLIQAILGISQFLNQRAVACKYLGLASHEPSVLGTSVVEASSGRWLRAYGGFDHPNIFGGVLALALIMAAYLLVKKKVIRSASEMSESIFLFIFYFIALLALFFSFSRAAWLALIIGFVYLLIALILKKDYWTLGRFMVLVLFSALMIFIVAFPYRDLLRARVDASSRLEFKSWHDRQSYLVEAEGLIKNNWLLGVGPGNYVTALERQDNYKKAVWDYQPVHNVFLLLWAESGVFSVVAFVAFLWLLKRDRRNIYSGAMLGALIVLMLLDHWLLSLPFGILFLCLMFGLM